MKSLAMLNFKNISPSADFYSKLDKLNLDMMIMSKNILYITHEIDKIHKILTNWRTEQQTLDYFGKKYGEDLGVTSPQTEQDEQ